MLKRAQQLGPYRENIKSALVKQLAALRYLLCIMGERLQQNGRVKNAEDVFFLHYDELRDFVSKPTQPDLLSLVASRRGSYAENQKLKPPGVIYGVWNFKNQKQIETETPGQLQGVGVSAGCVRGKAKVILRAGTERVEPGEILVAPFTDPGWTPYFMNSAAIVMDMGGLLSHGSIIARELGIPAVVNVGYGTTSLRTGQWIEVDGHKGVVRVLDPE